MAMRASMRQVLISRYFCKNVELSGIFPLAASKSKASTCYSHIPA